MIAGFSSPAPHSAPAAKSSESPGRMGVTTSPVSAKTMRKMTPYTQRAVRACELEQVIVDVKDEIYRRLHQDILSHATAGSPSSRPVPESLARCELTHLARVPIDRAVASAQHAQYEEALLIARLYRAVTRRRRTICRIPCSSRTRDRARRARDRHPSGRRIAAGRSATRYRRRLAEFRTLHAILAPGTLDGGDVLRLGRTLYVGLSTRTNEEGARQLAQLTSPFGYTRRIACRPPHVCTSNRPSRPWTRTACSPIPSGSTPDIFRRAGMTVIDVDPSEPHAANVLRIGRTLVAAASHARTTAMLAVATATTSAPSMSRSWPRPKRA